MSHRPSRVLIVTIALISAFTITQRTAFAVGPASVSVSPSAVSATVGDDVALDITVANVPAQPGLGGYVVALTWDPAVLSLTSLVDSGWLAAKGGNVVAFCETLGIDNAAGTASADCTPILAFGPGVSPSGALASAVFHAKSPGSTAINLGGSSLKGTSESSTIASTLTGSTVTIGAPAQVAATTDTPVPPVTPTLPAGRTSTPAPSSTPAAAPSGATSAETAAPTSAVLISQTPSTKPTQGTLSKVEVPPTGSGSPGGDGMTWWVPVLAAAAAILLGGGGVAAFRRANRRTDDR